MTEPTTAERPHRQHCSCRVTVERLEKERVETRQLVSDQALAIAEAEAQRDEAVGALRAYADGEQLARSFHELYEALAPEFGYKTRRESAVHWDDIPANNKTLMIAVASRIADKANAFLAGFSPVTPEGGHGRCPDKLPHDLDQTCERVSNYYTRSDFACATHHGPWPSDTERCPAAMAGNVTI